MKHIVTLFMLTLMVLTACAVEESTTETTVDHTPSTHVVEHDAELELEQVAVERFFDIRITQDNLDPSEIRVNKGDKVTFSVTSLIQLEDKERIKEDHDEQEESEIERNAIDPIRFQIDAYNIDAVVYQGTPLIIKFVAVEDGTFVMGDVTHETRKGIFIVE